MVAALTVAVAACHVLEPDTMAKPVTVVSDTGPPVTYQPTVLETGIDKTRATVQAYAPVAAAFDPLTGGLASPVAMGVYNILTLFGATVREIQTRRKRNEDAKRQADLEGALLEIHKDSPNGAPSIVADPKHKAVIAEVTGI